jgi:hypothetical protein
MLLWGFLWGLQLPFVQGKRLINVVTLQLPHRFALVFRCYRIVVEMFEWPITLSELGDPLAPLPTVSRMCAGDRRDGKVDGCLPSAKSLGAPCESWLGVCWGLACGKTGKPLRLSQSALEDSDGFLSERNIAPSKLRLAARQKNVLPFEMNIDGFDRGRS